MKIEDEIQQTVFKSEYQKLLINILFTANWLTEQTKQMLIEFELTPKQFNVLRILRGQYPEPATVKLIRDRMLDKMSDASRIVERLRVKGLIKRDTCDDNRRAVDVVITEQGLELLKRADETENQWEKLLFNLTVEEAVIMNDFLNKIHK